MDAKTGHAAKTLISALERPAATLVTICQMLLGLGLAITLVLKVYMLVFTDQVCIADGATLGNIIRCTPTLSLLSNFLIVVAGFRFAGQMFTQAPHVVLEPLLLALTGVLLQYLVGANGAGETWYFFLVVLVLFGAMSAVFAALRYWAGPRSPI
ncbi:hypothetical protein [Rhizobium leguminosarum]|uniref:hypothetical protein n=1 Tax=Rhizobium leguminosarum TaxID=384 RepID=UPI0013C09CFE|nr:hypothetical protein [Rhizobium leguminosarum]NEI03034.1 hypothetical protein [Rhizobium leguminosarum]NEJ47452.1 hypothetical protein [Rhizobium leguminosarum]NEJ54401.1 hypothetical protein [Rhizobium leguminosarum]NEJ82244.1 hypothetical protein [Rhizobium leguminosarum]